MTTPFKINLSSEITVKKTKIFLEFFKIYPGLRKFMGTKIALYYNPATADTFEEPTDSPSLQKETNLTSAGLQPDTSQVKSKSR